MLLRYSCGLNCILNYTFVSLLAIAEETLAEFLSKATGTAVDWVQMIGMKVTPVVDFVFLMICLFIVFVHLLHIVW